MRPIEDILVEAKVKGLRLNNLFELPSGIDDKTASGVYQANFHHANGWYDYGRGTSPSEALEDALARSLGHKGPENRPIPKTPPKIDAKADATLEDYF